MTSSTGPNCAPQLTHQNIAANAVRGQKVVIPINDAEAAIIDEARRRLISRITQTEILPPTPDLVMTTRQIPVPIGEYEIEIHSIRVKFSDDAPVRRARIATLLRSHFGITTKPEKTEVPKCWEFEIGISKKMEFAELEPVHQAIHVMASYMVNDVSIHGLYIAGLFTSQSHGDGSERFSLSGDHVSDNPWINAA